MRIVSCTAGGFFQRPDRAAIKKYYRRHLQGCQGKDSIRVVLLVTVGYSRVRDDQRSTGRAGEER
jgi:hypothetical protein